MGVEWERRGVIKKNKEGTRRKRERGKERGGGGGEREGKEL